MCGKNSFDNYDDEMFKKLHQQEQARHEAAIKAIEFFIGKYTPATNENAEVFFSTSEIQNAILIHTGGTLPAHEVYQAMVNMGYSFDMRNGLDLYWLLRKE